MHQQHLEIPNLNWSGSPNGPNSVEFGSAGGGGGASSRTAGIGVVEDLEVLMTGGWWWTIWTTSPQPQTLPA